MSKLSIEKIKKDIEGLLRDNPIEAIVGVLFFVIVVIEDLNWYHNSSMSWMFPTLFAIVYSFNQMFKIGWKRNLYYGSVLLVVPLVVFDQYFSRFIFSSAYFFTELLTLFLLLCYKKTTDNASFASHCVRVVVNLFFSIAVSGILLGILCAILFSIEYIFGFNLSFRVLTWISSFTFFVFAPLLFCRLQEWRDGEQFTLPKVGIFIINYILSPAIIIYAAILYLYLAMIATSWELPKGGVAYMVMGFVIFAFGTRLLQFILPQRYYDWFYRPLGIITTPLLVLFWVGALYRASQYGLTDMRVYLLASGALMTIYTGMIYVRRLSNYRLMLLLSSLVIAVLTYVPGVSAHSISMTSQVSRMQSLARELSLWDESTGKLCGTEQFKAADQVQQAKAEQLTSIYDYIQNHLGYEKATEQYGTYDLSTRSSDCYHQYEIPQNRIPIRADYKEYVRCNLNFRKDDNLEITTYSGVVLLKINQKEHFDKFRDQIAAWGSGEATSIDPFYVENDSCVVIISCIVREEPEGYHFAEYSSNVVAFIKK